MRRAIFLLAVLALLACSDGIIAPNTDVGLSVWAEVLPSMVKSHDTTTVVYIRLFVSNKTAHEIRVVSGGPPYVFTGDPVLSKGLWGSIRIGNNAKPLNAGPAVDFWGDSVYVVPAHYTEYDEFTVKLGKSSLGDWEPAPGAYRVRSWFNGREGKSGSLLVLP